jgi:hypothetical protein
MLQVAKVVNPVVHFLPVTEFGLRISVHNIGDLVTSKSGYDPLGRLPQHRILRL